MSKVLNRMIDEIDEKGSMCKCTKCDLVCTQECKVITGEFRKIYYCKGPY